MATHLAVFGAAGNMGTRVLNALKDDPEYTLLCVEAGEAGQAKLRERGFEPVTQEDALAQADMAILAVPAASAIMVIGSVA